MKFSIITVSYNSASTIADTINSVLSQSYSDIEYIIVDGGSTDNTIDIIRSYKGQIHKLISEEDDGIYDAINKGIKIAQGHIIALLHSDDVFFDKDVINRVAEAFSIANTQIVLADSQFINPKNGRVIRYYSSRNFKPSKFKFGYMPAHTAFFAKKDLFEKYGYYKHDYKIAADYELLLRFLLINNLEFRYVPITAATMRKGGISNKTISSKIILNREILRACRENGIKTNYLYIYSKYLTKIFEYRGI